MSSRSFEAEVFDRISSSEMYERFQKAFSTATGLPLGLVRGDDNWCAGVKENSSPFCELLNRCEVACDACLQTNLRLAKEAEEVEGPLDCRCFAGLCATLVPVNLGKTTIGYLRTGQVFNRTPAEEEFSSLLQQLGQEKVVTDETETLLKQAWLQTRQVEPGRYESMIGLLNLFADQLTAHAEKLALSPVKEEPPSIAAARLLIHREMDKQLPLAKLAEAAGMSVSHFSRTFKEATSQTVTEYITRVRINWAREELLNPSMQVAEIAYGAGFQSLSQFYRAFAGQVGMSPSEYRKQQQVKCS